MEKLGIKKRREFTPIIIQMECPSIFLIYFAHCPEPYIIHELFTINNNTNSNDPLFRPPLTCTGTRNIPELPPPLPVCTSFVSFLPPRSFSTCLTRPTSLVHHYVFFSSPHSLGRTLSLHPNLGIVRVSESVDGVLRTRSVFYTPRPITPPFG